MSSPNNSNGGGRSGSGGGRSGSGGGAGAWRMKHAQQPASPPATQAAAKNNSNSSSNDDKKQKRKKRRSGKKSSLRRMRISKESMNRLVMDYLVGKGYRDVAEAFWRDSNTKPHVDLQSVQERMSIQQLLLEGQIQKARSKLDLMDPLFLEKHTAMDFLLAKQELIELIKAHDVVAALSFAAQHLAPFGEKNPQFLQEIEHTMSLLAFDSHAQSSPLGSRVLLDQAQRRRVADEVNSAILRNQKQEIEPMLPTMVRQFRYMEDQLAIKLKRRATGIRFAHPAVHDDASASE